MASLMIAVVGSTAATAASIDLGHPTFPVQTSTDVSIDRGVVFDVLAPVSLMSAGILFDPLAGGATGLTVGLYDRTGAVPGARGPLLASDSDDIPDLGMQFYDVPLSYTLTPGNLYELVFHDGSGGWSFGNNNFELYGFHYPDTPYVAGGIFRIFDGTGDGDAVNTVMMHFRVDTQDVPEPGTMALFGLGLLGAGLVIRRKRRGV